MMEETKTPSGAISTIDAPSDGTPPVSVDGDASTRSSQVPWSMKVLAVILVSSIGFGSHWSSGVTGAMKSTLKKASTYTLYADIIMVRLWANDGAETQELNISNTQYSVLTSSGDFMTTVLMLFAGSVTDRIGGAGESHSTNLWFYHRNCLRFVY